MSSGPAVVLALEAPDAIKKWRTLMGATDPAKADAGTLRKDFGRQSRTTPPMAPTRRKRPRFELGYFFSGMEPVQVSLVIVIVRGIGLGDARRPLAAPATTGKRGNSRCISRSRLDPTSSTCLLSLLRR